MNRLNIISLLLIVASFFLFLGASYYYDQSFRHDYTYAKAIASVTTNLYQDEGGAEPSMTSSRYILTEERGVLITMLLEILLLGVSISLVLFSKKRFGSNSFHVPLVFGSILIAIWILWTIHLRGLWFHV